MDIVFFGSSNFAVPSLEALLASGQKVSCVVTQPDSQQGRGLRLKGTAIKETAKANRLRIYQPGDVNGPQAREILKALEPDLFLVIAYGQILSAQILGIPKIFPINIHASLLPKYRGAAPVNWAIIKGEKVTGISVIKMTEDMDAGPIILQEKLDIADSDTAVTLENKLSQVAARSLIDCLSDIKEKKIKLMPQDERAVSLAPKLKKNYGRIDWKSVAWDIYNLIRGCVPWPGAFTYYKGKLLKIYEAKVVVPPDSQDNLLPGKIIKVSKEGIAIATGKDGLLVKELQIEGKRKMKVSEFITGHKIILGETFDKK